MRPVHRRCDTRRLPHRACLDRSQRFSHAGATTHTGRAVRTGAPMYRGPYGIIGLIVAILLILLLLRLLGVI